MKKNNKGFTIVELVIVIAVIAILAAVLIPTFSGVVDKANLSSATQTARSTLTNALNMSDKAALSGQKSTGEYQTMIVINGYAFGYTGNQLEQIDYPTSDTTVFYNVATDSKNSFNTILIAAENLVADEDDEANYTQCSSINSISPTTKPSDWDEIYANYVDSNGTTAPQTFVAGTYYLKPTDWATSYKNYYKKVNEKFVLLDDDAAPSYKANDYYLKNAVATKYEIKNINSVITKWSKDNTLGCTNIDSVSNVTLVGDNYYLNLDAGVTDAPSGNYFKGSDNKYYSFAAVILVNSDFSNKVVVFTTFSL